MVVEPAAHTVWSHVAIKHGFRYPFLIQEILAMSALHLAQLRPSSSKHYYATATTLQTDAMKGFNEIQKSVDESSCVAVLLFTSLLALHVLADSTRTQELNLGGFIGDFVSCLRLMRSVRVVAISDFWEYLRTVSELEPLFNVPSPSPPYAAPEAVKALYELTASSSISEKAKEAYNQAIDRLEWLYDVSDSLHVVHTSVRWIVGWPAQLTSEYLELLDERRPEALIILAHYGAVLVAYRNSWMVGSRGSRLINAIDAYLGTYWEKWMRYPNDRVRNAEEATTQSSAIT